MIVTLVRQNTGSVLTFFTQEPFNSIIQKYIGWEIYAYTKVGT